MKRQVPIGLLAATIVLAVAAAAPAPALAACAQAADGRCESPGAACNPPADGRCDTRPASSLSKLSHACRCQSPRQWGPHASGGPKLTSCRQTCNNREITCDSRARNFTQRNACASRDASCNSHC